MPKGGPDGGDGGNGGSVYLLGRKELGTLYDLKIKPHYHAGRGQHGRGKNMHGRRGEDIFIPVPLGVLVMDGNHILGEILTDHDTLLVAKGGKGGRGNSHFASSQNQTPRQAEKGRPGEEKQLRVILKLISDIGIVGFPNVGKSTLLGALTNAQPKIADYPFTTLTPNLGVLRSEHKQIVIADMPGIIEGAHHGRGLGLQFLRHIERTNLLILLIDISSPNPLSQYQLLIEEFGQYSVDLSKKKRIVVFNKIDLLDKTPKYKLAEKVFYVSALHGNGLDRLADYLRNEAQI